MFDKLVTKSFLTLQFLDFVNNAIFRYKIVRLAYLKMNVPCVKIVHLFQLIEQNVFPNAILLIHVFFFFKFQKKF